MVVPDGYERMLMGPILVSKNFSKAKLTKWKRKVSHYTYSIHVKRDSLASPITVHAFARNHRSGCYTGAHLVAFPRLHRSTFIFLVPVVTAHWDHAYRMCLCTVRKIIGCQITPFDAYKQL